jgi:hypothetical protein
MGGGAEEERFRDLLAKAAAQLLYVFTLFSHRLLAELTEKGKPCLFVETMPIYKAVATGNRNNEFY